MILALQQLKKISGRVNQMIDTKPKTKWHIIGESVKGASHERSGQPNQDAIGRSSLSGDSLPLIVAVSDGHGGAKYFRSDKGASFAVKAAIDTLSQFEESLANFSNSSWLKENLAKSLVNTWRSEVNAHLQSEEFTAEEMSKLEEKEGAASQQIVKGNPVLAYGATILVVMITESFIAYLQLGDGDILTVSEQGESESVFPVHRKHFANETTSLCSSNAWCDFQFQREKISSSSTLPALILLSTDGYKDSFSSNEAFHKVGSDLYEMIHSNKLEEIKSNLSGWLSEASQIGSGDDITLGILCRRDAFQYLDAPQSSEQELELELENHIEGGNLEPDAQSGHSDGPLQPELTGFRNTPGEKTGGKTGGEKAKGKTGGKPGKKTKRSMDC
jgi:serine/threonine protein phosphatase PrpC